MGVAASIGVFGGLTKLASIPHFLALGGAAVATCVELRSLTLSEAPLAWVSCVAALAYYVPVLLGDIGELHQVFVQNRYFVLMPDGVVHPLTSSWEPDRSVALDMTAMYLLALKAEDQAGEAAGAAINVKTSKKSE